MKPTKEPLPTGTPWEPNDLIMLAAVEILTSWQYSGMRSKVITGAPQTNPLGRTKLTAFGTQCKLAWDQGHTGLKPQKAALEVRARTSIMLDAENNPETPQIWDATCRWHKVAKPQVPMA